MEPVPPTPLSYPNLQLRPRATAGAIIPFVLKHRRRSNPPRILDGVFDESPVERFGHEYPVRHKVLVASQLLPMGFQKRKNHGGGGVGGVTQKLELNAHQ